MEMVFFRFPNFAIFRKFAIFHFFIRGDKNKKKTNIMFENKVFKNDTFHILLEKVSYP